VAARLGEILGKNRVVFVEDCVGDEVKKAIDNLEPGQILLLENLRYYAAEEDNDREFAKKLASLADVFVQDGFGVVHRKHASTDAITRYLPSVAGLLLEKEFNTITEVMEKPERPLMAVIGGAKISDKIDILDRFIATADVVVVGGAMSNTFLAADGVEVGESLIEKSEISLAKDIIARAEKRARKEHFVFYIPQDGVVASKIDKTAETRIVDWSAHVIAEIQNYPKRPPRSTGRVRANEMILDIGPFSGSFIAGCVQLAKTVVWNGAMGVTEVPGLQGPIGPFAQGTELLVDALLGEFGHKPYSLVGGGDTVGYIESRGLTECFNHVSTGGGASLELMAGRKLPGIEALLDKKA
jgi:phosphoglycerate kinase